MSFLTQTAGRRMAMYSRVAMIQAPRPFSTSILFQKSVTDTAKDTLKQSAVDTAKNTLKQADRKVSDKIVDGINATTSAASKVTGTNVGGGKQANKSAEQMRAEETAKKEKSH